MRFRDIEIVHFFKKEDDDLNVDSQLSLLSPSAILKVKITERAVTHESIFRKSSTFSLK